MILNLVVGRGYMQSCFFVRHQNKEKPSEKWQVLLEPDMLKGLRTTPLCAIKVHYLPGAEENRKFIDIVRMVRERNQSGAQIQELDTED